MHFIVSFYVSCSHLLLPDNRGETLTYRLVCVTKYSWWVEYYLLSCKYHGWPVKLWLFPLKGFLGKDVEAFSVAISGL